MKELWGEGDHIMSTFREFPIILIQLLLVIVCR